MASTSASISRTARWTSGSAPTAIERLPGLRNSQFIEGYDVYPLRRATAVLFAAGPDASLPRVDIQIQLKVDDEWTDRYLWVGGIDLYEGSVDAAARSDSARDSLACQVSNFLREGGIVTRSRGH